MYVLGTAGHVDHGKSSLILALTGIDPDRLIEEKERGLTIELGFAWLELPSGREVSIIDVPGHERFIKNMLAGIGGIDVALLIVAADEGVMPQTREHLAILDLLNIHSGLVAITKKDLVDQEMMELVQMDIEDVLKGTSLEGSPVVATSVKTGEGLEELTATIDGLLENTSTRRDIGKPRLAIDRVFTMKGFGTVVTGTLVDGSLSTGQTVEILPAGLKAGIRGLQTHKKKMDTVLPGTRVAVNLSGISLEALSKGDVVAIPGWMKPTRFMDVKLRAVSNLPRPITHNKAITFHTGSSETAGKIRILDKDRINPGESGWAQVVLSHPVAATSGDAFVIRSATNTLGGGTIVDTNPKRHRRFLKAVIDNLETKERGSPEEILIATLEDIGPADLNRMVTSTNLSAEIVKEIAIGLANQGSLVVLGKDLSRSLFFSSAGWNLFLKTVQNSLSQFHKQFPLRSGMPKEEFRNRARISSQHFPEVLRKLIEDGTVFEEDKLVRLSSHNVTFSPVQQAEVDTFLQSLKDDPYSPQPAGLSDPEILNALIEKRQVVKLSDGVIFASAAFEEMVKRIVEHLKSNGTITVAQVRDMFGTSRKYALALMEHLDEQKITRRVDDERVLR